MGVAEPRRTGETALPDGRVLGWAEWGSPRGTPVLLCPGAATSRRLGFGSDVVDALRVRLISVDRPGLGASTAAPWRSLTDFADDMRVFIDVRHLGRPAVVGNSQGAPFALACAGLSRGLAIVSGADEVAAPEFRGALPGGLRELVDTVSSDPAAAERFFAGFDADGMWRMVMGNATSSDQPVYGDAAFRHAYRTALREAFAQGSAGYARDTVLAMSRWPLRLDEISVPVDIWYGEQDVSHSPDNGVTLAARIPTSRRRIVPGGGSVLWTHSEWILRSLLDFP